jgi:hypothetical protein
MLIMLAAADLPIKRALGEKRASQSWIVFAMVES